MEIGYVVNYYCQNCQIISKYSSVMYLQKIVHNVSFIFIPVSNGNDMLTLDKQEDFVLVGASPKYKCTVNQNANFLIGNPLKWEKRGRDGSKVVISVLANVEAGLATEYNVQLDTTDNAMSFTLSFKQG